MFQKQRKMIVKTKIWSKNSEKLLENDKFWPNIYFNVPKTAKYGLKQIKKCKNMSFRALVIINYITTIQTKLKKRLLTCD